MTGDDKESGGCQRCIPQELATGMLILVFVFHNKKVLSNFALKNIR